MIASDELNAIIERIASGTETQTDIETLRLALTDSEQNALQLGKYNINIGQGQDIQIGDRFYVEWNDEAIQALLQVVQKQLSAPAIGISATQLLKAANQPPTAPIDNLLAQILSELKEAMKLFNMRIQPNQVDVSRTYEKVCSLIASIYQVMDLIDEPLPSFQSNLMSIRVRLEAPDEGIVAYLEKIGAELLALASAKKHQKGKFIQHIRVSLHVVERKLKGLINLL